MSAACFGGWLEAKREAEDDAADANADRQQRELLRAYEAALDCIDGVDLSMQLDDSQVRRVLCRLARRAGDDAALLIGRIVIAVHQDYAQALAQRQVLGERCSQSSDPAMACMATVAAVMSAGMVRELTQ